MEIGGPSHPFLSDLIPPDFRPELFALVCRAWTTVGSNRNAKLEPRITGLLRRAIIDLQEQHYKRPPFFIIEEVKKRDPVTGKETERTDIEIHLCGWYIKGQRPYFVFESKRLNIVYAKRITPNTAEYVGPSGMGCLVAAQYESTRSYSGMLGFVMNADLKSAEEAVRTAIGGLAGHLNIRGIPELHAFATMPSGAVGFETHHRDGTADYIMFHLLLPKSV